MLYVIMCDKMKAIIVHRDSSNEATQTKLPPVLPPGLVKLRPAEFLCKVCDQRNHLNHSFLLPAHINTLGDQHKEIIMAYCVEPTTRTFM